MNEKIDWMMGMAENMKNISQSNMDKPMMNEFFDMSMRMQDNLDRMRSMDMPDDMVDIMEQMMRSMEQVMINMDKDSQDHKMAMKYMMSYMIMVQMSKMR